ncbi:MAG TPA: phage Gp37/Gp68 family protein [Deltaproteobacteria bacterium]|nr:phage Gp37/Gp68 family protein [Deltaproteobacteria bacterium]
MNKTDIEYLDYTWNPIAMRCTPVSEGCAHCWHLRMADRLAGNPKIGETLREVYSGRGGLCNGFFPWIGGTRAEFDAPEWKKQPSRIGVQFMGDLFHERVHFDTIHGVWDVMKACPQHTFIILTKRPERMKEVLSRIYSLERFGAALGFWRHVWLGVTVENQARADERIPILLQIPAAVRFVSIEPMLGPVDLNAWIHSVAPPICDPAMPLPTLQDGGRRINRLDWVILGGETGPGPRPLHPDRVRSARDQCVSAGVPFFFKQWGEFIVPEDGARACRVCGCTWNNACDGGCYWVEPDLCSSCIGKPVPAGERPVKFRHTTRKAAGRLLDGREWLEIPEGRP